MKKILIGITGCIATYKIPDIITALRKSCPDIYIKTIATPNGLEFITPMVLKVRSDEYLDSTMTGKKITHVDCNQDIDVLVILPATADFIAKVVYGIADNLLLATVLATPSNVPRIIFPAMNTNMYLNVATQRNIKTLKRDQWYVVEPIEGNLACGIKGIGKLVRIPTIVENILALRRKRIKIRDNSDSGFWYDAYAGKEFNIVREYNDAYSVNNPFNEEFQVAFLNIKKNDCEEI